MNPARDVAEYLQTRGVGTVGTNIFYGTLPDTPDSAIVCRNAVPEPSTFTVSNSSTAELEYPGVQVWARASTDDAAATLARSAYDALVGLRGGATMNARAYASVRVEQVPFSVGRDNKDRHEYSLNITLTYTP